MGKKVIQVPVDERLLKYLDKLSKRQRKARAELIRQACWHYLSEMELEELDKLYRQGYQKIPEESEIGEAQVTLAGEIMSEESW